MEERLSELCSKLDDLIALYKLVHSDTIEARKGQLLENENRRKIYDLCDGNTGVTEMGRQLGISQPAVSAHTTSLAQAGLLGKVTIDGRTLYQRRLEE